MDPLSVATSVAGLLAMTVQVVKLIKQTIETYKKRRPLLLKLLDKVERMRLMLHQLRSLTQQLAGRSSMALAFNDSACRETINELQTLVTTLATGPSWMDLPKAKFYLNQGKANELEQRLQEHEKEINTLLLFIATESSLKTEAQIRKVIEASATRSKAAPAFITSSPKASLPYDQAVARQRYPIWPGQKSRSVYDSAYRQVRDNLSDAAHAGNWDAVFQALENGQNIFSESWINFPRLNKDPEQASGWTPLHQAIINLASEDVVERLLKLGALLTLRTTLTNPTRFPYTNMTALEMAHDMGYPHDSSLCKLLSPTIRYNIPSQTLDRLQARFHDRIQEDLGSGDGDGEYGKHLRLPELEVLRELEVPQMGFPLVGPGVNEQKGYLYRLDGRELLVQKYGLNEDKQYRITETETLEIEQAWAFPP